MWKFLKKIFSGSKSDVTVLLLDEQDPTLSGTFRLNTTVILVSIVSLVLASGMVTTLMFYLTPLGALYKDRQNDRIRTEVLAIAQRITELQDSLDYRDRQLEDLKFVLRSNADTVFPVSLPQMESMTSITTIPLVEAAPEVPLSLDRIKVMYAEQDTETSIFPLVRPVAGLMTQGFNPSEHHYGIDIAVREGAVFSSMFSGTIVSSVWTPNYGIVLTVQHPTGALAVYKHVASSRKREGDIVLRGEILGTAGHRGVLSSGSHLHTELWIDGIPENPETYLIK